MHFVKQYLRQHWKTMCALVLFSVLSLCVFWLYRLPLAAVGFALLVCAVPGLVMVIVDFVHFCHRHQELQKMVGAVNVAIDRLPEPEDAIEEDYQQLLTTLHQENETITLQMDTRYYELVDYYTLWAHQIKTPIAAMYLQLQDNDAPEAKELHEELQRIEQYVEMVMCYLRLDSRSSDYVIRKYDLDSIVKQAVRKCASQFIRKKISLEYQPLQATVLTDEKWLLFVIAQVLSNALKYTRSGEITISLEQPCMLCIQDTGIGIAPEDLPRVFEKGYTGYNGRTDKKASGIGLYLCREILRRLHHTIAISSQPGVGTTVKIDLSSARLSVE